MNETKPKSLKTKDEIFQIVKDAIVGLLVIEESDIQLTSLPQSLGIDSLDTIELIMYIEEEMDIEINDEQIERCETIQDVVNEIFKSQ